MAYRAYLLLYQASMSPRPRSQGEQLASPKTLNVTCRCRDCPFSPWNLGEIARPGGWRAIVLEVTGAIIMSGDYRRGRGGDARHWFSSQVVWFCRRSWRWNDKSGFSDHGAAKLEMGQGMPDMVLQSLRHIRFDSCRRNLSISSFASCLRERRVCTRFDITKMLFDITESATTTRQVQ